jgi:hypothetical protein
MVDMVGDQTANQAVKSLKKGGKKKNMGEMVGDQIAKEAAQPLKKGGKKKKENNNNNNHHFWNSRIAGCLSCSVTPLVSSPVCVSLRHVWSPLVAALVEAW